MGSQLRVNSGQLVNVRFLLKQARHPVTLEGVSLNNRRMSSESYLKLVGCFQFNVAAK